MGVQQNRVFWCCVYVSVKERERDVNSVLRRNRAVGKCGLVMLRTRFSGHIGHGFRVVFEVSGILLRLRWRDAAIGLAREGLCLQQASLSVRMMYGVKRGICGMYPHGLLLKHRENCELQRHPAFGQVWGEGCSDTVPRRMRQTRS
jgi:hypothetical protein